MKATIETLRGSPVVRRVGAVAVALVLAVNAVVLLGGFASAPAVVQTTDTSEERAADAATVTPAAVDDAEAIEIELDPLEDLIVPAPSQEAVEAGVELPVPKVPPSDPYAPTPEVRHGMLEIPAIGLSQPLFEGVTLTAINRGPSHWPGTAMPGELGNVVVAGHRTTYTRPFWDLQALTPGDELIFTMNDGTRHVYVLDEIEIVSPTDVHIIEQRPEHQATLFACHPRGSARQRIVGHFSLKPQFISLR